MAKSNQVSSCPQPSGETFLYSVCVYLSVGSLQVQVHKKRAQNTLQGCSETGDQTQTPVLPREDDLCDHGECDTVQRSGVLPAPKAAEHQEPCQVVQDLEGQAQGVRGLNAWITSTNISSEKMKCQQTEQFFHVK